MASMDAEFLREKVGERLSKAVAAACASGVSDKIDYIAEWLLQQVSLEEAGVAEAERVAVLATAQEGSLRIPSVGEANGLPLTVPSRHGLARPQSAMADLGFDPAETAPQLGEAMPGRGRITWNGRRRPRNFAPGGVIANKSLIKTRSCAHAALPHHDDLGRRNVLSPVSRASIPSQRIHPDQIVSE